MARLIGPAFLCVGILWVLFTAGAPAQGVFTFNNSSATKITNACCVGPEWEPSAGVNVAVYFSANTNLVTTQTHTGLAVNPNAITNTLSGVLAGLFIGGERSFPEVPEGGFVAMQVRAWSGGFASYEEAFAHYPDAAIGSSALFVLGPLGGPGTPTPKIFGPGRLQPFRIGAMPEPSIYALGALGLGVFAAFRWRRSRP